MLVAFGLVALAILSRMAMERYDREDAVVWRDIGRLVRESKRHEIQARETVRKRMAGTYAVAYRRGGWR